MAITLTQVSQEIQAAVLARRSSRTYNQWISRTKEAASHEISSGNLQGLQNRVSEVLAHLEPFFRATVKKKPDQQHFSQEEILSHCLEKSFESFFAETGSLKKGLQGESPNKQDIKRKFQTLAAQLKKLQPLCSGSLAASFRAAALDLRKIKALFQEDTLSEKLQGLRDRITLLTAQADSCAPTSENAKILTWTVLSFRTDRLALEKNASHFSPSLSSQYNELAVREKALLTKIKSLRSENTCFKLMNFAKRIGLGAVGGFIVSSLMGNSWNSFPTFFLSLCGAVVGNRVLAPKTPITLQYHAARPLREVRGTVVPGKLKERTSKEALKLLNHFFYCNYSGSITPEEIDGIDALQPNPAWLPNNTTAQLGNTTQVARSHEEFQKYFTSLKSTTTSENPSGLVINDAQKSISIGMDINAKKEFVIAIFDPTTSSCLYYQNLNDAVIKVYELTHGSACSFQKVSYAQPQEMETSEPIPRAGQVKISGDIRHVKRLLVNLVLGNRRLYRNHLPYKFEELCDLFRKACNYFKPLTMQQLAQVFLQGGYSFETRQHEEVRFESEEAALKALCGALTLDADASTRSRLFHDDRTRKERLMQYLTPSGKFSAQDLGEFFQFETGSVSNFPINHPPTSGVWTSLNEETIIRRNGVLRSIDEDQTHLRLRYESPSPSLFIVTQMESPERGMLGGGEHALVEGVRIYPGDSVLFPENREPITGQWYRIRDNQYVLGSTGPLNIRDASL